MILNNSSRIVKKPLQVAVAIGGLVPVSAGFLGILLGPQMTGDILNLNISLDSHFRYLSGLLLGIGICFWTTIPDIEYKGSTFRFLTAIVVIGGLGRLWSLVIMGVPDQPMLFGLAMELVVTPLLAVWQYRLSTRIHKDVSV